MQQCIKILLFHIYMKLKHVSVEGCWTCSWWTLSGIVPVPDNVHQLHVQQPFTYAKPEAASAVLSS